MTTHGPATRTDRRGQVRLSQPAPGVGAGQRRRETATRVAMGAVCKALLAQFGVQVGSYVTAIGGVQADPGAAGRAELHAQRFELAEGDRSALP